MGVRPPTTEALILLASCSLLRPQVHGSGWGTVVTPLRIAAWERGLAGHPDREFAWYVCTGIREGFRVGFNYVEKRCKPVFRNMKSVEDHREVVEQYIFGEREEGRVLGPFRRERFPQIQVSPFGVLGPFRRERFPQIQVSPFGVIPKSEPGKWQLILDLSAPEGCSVNDGICSEWCSLSYMSVDDVAAEIVSLGRGAQMAKFDLKSAYRNVPVHPDDRWLLGMLWDDQLFIDAALPFGLRSAPMIFNAVAEALAFIIRLKGVRGLGHYLDDFVIVGPPEPVVCCSALERSLETCSEVGFPVAVDKTEGPASQITFLGIELDSEACQLRLPQGKLEKLRIWWPSGGRGKCVPRGSRSRWQGT